MVYAHFYGLSLIFVILLSRKKIVVHLHGQDVRNMLLSRWQRVVLTMMSVRVHSFIAVSQFLADSMYRALPRARRKMFIVNCGVDLDVFEVAPRPAGPTAFLCVGALNRRKNVCRLARAFAQVKRPGETLTFIGDDEDGLADELSMIDGVTVRRPVASAEIAAAIAQSHVVCQPSETEPFGLGALEGIASGRPVVGTQEGGHEEFLPREARVLVNPFSETSIAEGLRAAADLDCPNAAARPAAELHDITDKAREIGAILEAAARG